MALQPSTKPRSRRHNRRAITRWVKRALLVLAGLGIVALIVRAWMPKPVVVDLGTVARMPLEVEVDEDGQTRVRDRFVVASPINGTLQRIDLEAGAPVEAGTPVARIEPPAPPLLDERSRREASARLDAAIAHERGAAAAIERSKVARDAAIREAERARQLLQHDAITAAERDRLELDEQLAIRGLAAAEADRSAALAEVAAVRAILGTGRGGQAAAAVAIASPVRGEVLRVLRESNGPVAAGTPLMEIGDVGAIEVVVDVLSNDAARVQPGMRCQLGGWGGPGELAGEVRRVEPSAFTRISALGVEEQRVKVIVSIVKPPAALGDGFRVDARIILWHGDNVLTVPASAVFRDHERWAVYAVQEGKARLVPIEIGHRGRLQVEVVKGLGEGARIVLHPSDNVRDGVSLEASR